MSGRAFVMVMDSAEHARLGVDGDRISEAEFWNTPAVHAWLQAHEVGEGASVRVVPAAQADLIPREWDRLEVPVTDEEEAGIARAASSPA